MKTKWKTPSTSYSTAVMARVTTILAAQKTSFSLNWLPT